MLLLVGGCVYFNTMYNAGKDYGAAERAIRSGDNAGARSSMDSVIAKTGRVIAKHPDSKYADDAALMKARAEIYRELWESAQVSARFAVSATSDERMRSTALGLDGLASFHLAEYTDADSLLSASLDGELEPADRTNFLVTRGRVRLALGQPDAAADDLTRARREVEPSMEARLDLARALSQVGRYDEAVDVSRDVLSDSRMIVFDGPVRSYLDSLIALAPVRVDTMIEALLQVEGPSGPQRSFFYLLQGRARQLRGDREGALESLLASREAAPQVRTAGEASLMAARQIIQDATEPEQVSETVGLLRDARRLSAADVNAIATRILVGVDLFTSLMAAYDSRGEEAAEALLRAAEIAASDLDAGSVARGLYLEYLEVVPGSRWAAKAMYGALSLSDRRAGGRVADQGADTNAALRTAMRALPEDDPYRASVLGATVAADAAADSAGGPAPDSLYVLAEADLQTRLREIQGLFDPSVFLTGPDSIVAVEEKADSANAPEVID